MDGQGPIPPNMEKEQDIRSEPEELAKDLYELVYGDRILYNEELSSAMRYFGAIARALILFRERSRTYGNSWQRHGALGNLLKLDIKNTRLMNSFWFAGESDPPTHKEAADDALDAVNYSAFFYECQAEGNMRGRNR